MSCYITVMFLSCLYKKKNLIFTWVPTRSIVCQKLKNHHAKKYTINGQFSAVLMLCIVGINVNFCEIVSSYQSVQNSWFIPKLPISLLKFPGIIQLQLKDEWQMNLFMV